MSDSENNSNKERNIGFFACAGALLITIIYTLICMFGLGDTNIFHQWYYIAAAYLFSLLILAGSLLVKGKMSMGVNSILCFVVLVCIGLSYWFRTERITVLDGKDAFLKAVKCADDTELMQYLEKNAPRRVFVFVGKPVEKDKLADGDATINSEDAKKNLNDLLKDLKKEAFNELKMQVNVQTKGDSDEIRKLIKNTKFTKVLSNGIVVFTSPLKVAFEEKDGSSVDDLKKQYGEKKSDGE